MGACAEVLMTHLILSPRHTPDSNTLWKAALNLGWKINRLYKYRIEDNTADSTAKIYGENLFVEVIAQQLGIALIAIPPSWLATLPTEYLKRKVELKRLKDCRSFTEKLFIKPASGKLFDARVYDSGTELPSSDIQDDKTPVLVSEPVTWAKEFRCFIKQQRLMTLSAYSLVGELHLDASPQEFADAENFCRKLLNDTNIHLPPSIVIDIGIIKDRGWAVVEANPTFASGIYNCDPAKVLDCLEFACFPANGISDDLKQWMVNAV